jgi:hypothetical protein
MATPTSRTLQALDAIESATPQTIDTRELERTAMLATLRAGGGFQAVQQVIDATLALGVALEAQRQALAKMEQAVRLAHAGAIRWGIREGADMDSYTYHWWSFPRTLLVDDLTAEDLADRVAHGEWYGGPGRPFTHRPSVRVKGSRVLVTQVSGWDI